MSADQSLMYDFGHTFCTLIIERLEQYRYFICKLFSCPRQLGCLLCFLNFVQAYQVIEEVRPRQGKRCGVSTSAHTMPRHVHIRI